ncbi:hypothetical protein EVAR_40327_1 [Eumeta japonica]|uniref:RNase H type-1 domain-containing protein n=1 Tax=Eumeta variegata TaxID=151549 RepID=A0A4C1Y9X8_EUMVA|nr:hypothetical protein EVAR_40327_1 [Eumeta japonica]
MAGRNGIGNSAYRLESFCTVFQAVRLFWVRAHAGTTGNERADEVARNAASKGRRQRIMIAFHFRTPKRRSRRRAWTSGSNDTPRETLVKLPCASFPGWKRRIRTEVSSRYRLRAHYERYRTRGAASWHTAAARPAVGGISTLKCQRPCFVRFFPSRIRLHYPNKAVMGPSTPRIRVDYENLDITGKVKSSIERIDSHRCLWTLATLEESSVPPGRNIDYDSITISDGGRSRLRKSKEVGAGRNYSVTSVAAAPAPPAMIDGLARSQRAEPHATAAHAR